MTKIVPSFCRICEPLCPVLAEVDDAGKVVKLSPDPDHPCGGIACHKGLSFLEVHNDPDRLNWPLRRLNPRSEAQGNFVDTDWDSALSDIGAKLKTIREQYGKDSVAFYFGNPAGFDASALLMTGQFQDLIDTKMRFSSVTQDAANRVILTGEIYGSYSSFMMPDIYNTDYLLCVGSNPKVSRWTLTSIPNDGLAAIKRIRERGGKVRFVNPRQVESSTVETGPTLLIKPGTDVYFLAAVTNEIDLQGGFDERLLATHGKHVDELRAFVRRYPAEKVAKITGLDTEAIKQIASEIVAAKSACLYAATGINQSRQGVLCSWLVEMISFVTGNLGREGGSYKPNGLTNYFPPMQPPQVLETSIGSFELSDPIGFHTLPAVLLPELIENGDVKALITLAGNPLLSVAGERPMREACEKLAMMVSIDIYRNTTAEMADYVLPGTDWMERIDVNLLGCEGQQPIPYVQYTDALEEPAYGRRDVCWILARLAQLIGVPSPALGADSEMKGAKILIEEFLSVGNLSIDQLKEAPHQTVVLEQTARDNLYERCLQHPDKKVDCCPSSFAKFGLFDRCDVIFSELENEPEDTLKLISLRTRYMHNSWMANSEKFRRGKHLMNPLNISEADAAARGLYNGDPIKVCTHYGSVETHVLITDDLRPGVVAMSHGFGNNRTFGLQVALENPGANCNSLMPTGEDTYEPLSYMSWLSGVPVTVEKISV